MRKLTFVLLFMAPLAGNAQTAPVADDIAAAITKREAVIATAEARVKPLRDQIVALQKQIVDAEGPDVPAARRELQLLKRLAVKP